MINFTQYELAAFALQFDPSRFNYETKKRGGAWDVGSYAVQQVVPFLEAEGVDPKSARQVRAIIFAHGYHHGKAVRHRPSLQMRAPGWGASAPFVLAFRYASRIAELIVRHELGLDDLPTTYLSTRQRVRNRLRRYAPQEGPHVDRMTHKWRDDWRKVLRYERARNPAWMTDPLPEVLQRIVRDDLGTPGIDAIEPLSDNDLILSRLDAIDERVDAIDERFDAIEATIGE